MCLCEITTRTKGGRGCGGKSQEAKLSHPKKWSARPVRALVLYRVRGFSLDNVQWMDTAELF